MLGLIVIFAPWCSRWPYWFLVGISILGTSPSSSYVMELVSIAICTKNSSKESQESLRRVYSSTIKRWIGSI